MKRIFFILAFSAVFGAWAQSNLPIGPAGNGAPVQNGFVPPGCKPGINCTAVPIYAVIMPTAVFSATPTGSLTPTPTGTPTITSTPTVTLSPVTGVVGGVTILNSNPTPGTTPGTDGYAGAAGQQMEVKARQTPDIAEQVWLNAVSPTPTAPAVRVTDDQSRQIQSTAPGNNAMGTTGRALNVQAQLQAWNASSSNAAPIASYTLGGNIIAGSTYNGLMVANVENIWDGVGVTNYYPSENAGITNDYLHTKAFGFPIYTASQNFTAAGAGTPVTMKVAQKYYTLGYNLGTGITAMTVTLSGSLNGTNYYDIGNTGSVSASGYVTFGPAAFSYFKITVGTFTLSGTPTFNAAVAAIQ